MNLNHAHNPNPRIYLFLRQLFGCGLKKVNFKKNTVSCSQLNLNMCLIKIMVEVAVKKYMVKFVVENIVDDKIIKKKYLFYNVKLHEYMIINT